MATVLQNMTFCISYYYSGTISVRGFRPFLLLSAPDVVFLH